MGINSFKTYPEWVAILKEKAENHDLEFDADPVNPKRRESYRFKIASDKAVVMGKTHHSNWFGQRNKNQIETVYTDEKELSSEATSLIQSDGQYERNEILAVVINHKSDGEYIPELDDFLVLDEVALEQVPASGKKQFRDDSNGYPSPFGAYLNEWSRIFELFEDFSE
mgnify:FL=1